MQLLRHDNNNETLHRLQQQRKCHKEAGAQRCSYEGRLYVLLRVAMYKDKICEQQILSLVSQMLPKASVTFILSIEMLQEARMGEKRKLLFTKSVPAQGYQRPRQFSSSWAGPSALRRHDGEERASGSEFSPSRQIAD